MLSPGSVVAGGNHTCESIMVLVNTCFLDHGTLPKEATVQLDNASTNKCMLVLAFMGVYCVHGVFEQARVRFCLEHHAHDVYDAFHAIHSKALCQNTFFHYEEMIAITKGAHAAARDRHAREGGQDHTIMGHDVQVSNLWQIRDLWEWLVPGYRTDKEAAWARAAFVSYEKIQPYRDFLIKPEADGVDGGRRVGLWAKQFMSDQDYRYIGTLLTSKMYNDTIGGRLPQLMTTDTSDCKDTRETERCSNTSVP